MFVRWRHRSEKLIALLVKIARVNGAPRQQHIAVLGSVPKSGGGWRDRCEFWEEVVSRLDDASYSHRMSLAERTKIEDAIALKVPRPNKRERAQWNKLQERRS
jgi:hypothetical protein